MRLRKPSLIGVAFMGDLFGDWVNPDKQCSSNPHFQTSYAYSLKEIIFHTIKMCSEHTFLFLTKCPWNYMKWSPFPSNCWVGATATNIEQYKAAVVGLAPIEAKIKYISFEPLLEYIPANPPYNLDGIDWVILGAQAKPNKQPDSGWVNAILNACDVAGVPGFMKNNLVWQYRRQEMPRDE